MSNATSCVRFLLAAYLLIYMLSGLAVLGFVIYVLCELSKYDNLVESAKRPIWHLIGPMLFLQVTAFLGYKAIWCKQYKLLRWFAGCVVITICWEIGGGLWCIAEKSNFPDKAPMIMLESFNSALKDDEVMKSWDFMQQTLHCCGIDGTVNYKKTFPISCCGTKNDESPNCSYIYQRGCYESFTELIGNKLIHLMLAIIGLSFVQIPCVFGACCLANRTDLEQNWDTRDETTRLNRSSTNND